MRQVFLFAGQSNMSAYSPTIVLRDDTLPAPYVPGYAQTAANEWTGAAPASIDSGYQYRYPTAALYPCLYNENARGGMDGVFDTWGAFVKQSPQFNLGGGLGVVGSYGLELPFLAKFIQEHPTTPVAAVKQSLGGTSLRGDWLPNTVPLGSSAGGTTNTLTLATSDFGTSSAYVGRVLRIVSGVGAGQTRTISAYNSTTKVATVSSNWTTVPGACTYGIERLQYQLLRTMIGQAAARLDTSDGPGNWRWAAFIWMQGESGAHNPAGLSDDSQYLSDSRALYAAVRSDTGRADLPVLVGRIGDNWLNTNAYLTSLGYPWRAIDYSITSGGLAVTDTRRNNCLASATLRRATQVALGADLNCAWWSNDGYPTRPLSNDTTGYHWAGPGNQAAGERAYAKWSAAFDAPVPVRRVFLSTAAGGLALRVGGA